MDEKLFLKDEDLLLRLAPGEDHFVERKTKGDSKDFLKTAVAFANSTPVNVPAILFIGVKNDGTIEDENDVDRLQKTFTEKVGRAYPPIPYYTKSLVKDEKPFLAVIIPGSSMRPHFAGKSYIRKGSETFEASDLEFNNLISHRNSKTYFLQEWINKKITVDWINRAAAQVGTAGRVSHTWDATLKSCNHFYLTVDVNDSLKSFSLNEVSVSFDDAKNRLKLELDHSR